MQRYTGTAPFGASVLVRVAGGGDAAIYADSGGSIRLPNPVPVGAGNSYSFCAPTGEYVLTVIAGGTAIQTIPGVRLADAADINARPRLQIVATRGIYPTGTESGATDTRFESSYKVTTGREVVNHLRLVYVNRFGAGFGVGERDPDFSGTYGGYTLEAALVRPDGKLARAYFGGKLRPYVDAGSPHVISDPIGLFLPAGSVFDIRSGALADAAGTAIVGCSTVASVTHTRKVRSSGASQVYAVSTMNGTAAGFGFLPACVVGVPERQHVSVFAWGDSIGLGQNTAAGGIDNTDPDQHYGWIGRGLKNVRGDGYHVPYVNVSKGGERSVDVTASSSWGRWSLIQYATHAVFTVSTNDISNGVSLDTLKANCLEMWARARRAGCKVAHSTMTPHTSSTDGWTTAGGQTPSASKTTGSARGQFNAWLWAQVAAGNLDGVIDVNAAVADPLSPDVWRTDLGALTEDGIHPNSLGYAVMGDAFRAIAASWVV